MSGIRPENLENAEDFKKVQGEVAEIIKDKIVVGQSIGYDMNYLFLHHRAEMLRDTSELFYKTDGKKYSLKELAANKLGISFQMEILRKIRFFFSNIMVTVVVNRLSVIT